MHTATCPGYRVFWVKDHDPKPIEIVSGRYRHLAQLKEAPTSIGNWKINDLNLKKNVGKLINHKNPHF